MKNITTLIMTILLVAGISKVSAQEAEDEGKHVFIQIGGNAGLRAS